MRIWDLILLEGGKIPFRIALALLRIHEEAILKLDDAGDIFSAPKTFAKKTYDADELVKVAIDPASYTGLLSFSFEEITQLRTKYFAQVYLSLFMFINHAMINDQPILKSPKVQQSMLATDLARQQYYKDINSKKNGLPAS